MSSAHDFLITTHLIAAVGAAAIAMVTLSRSRAVTASTLCFNDAAVTTAAAAVCSLSPIVAVWTPLGCELCTYKYTYVFVVVVCRQSIECCCCRTCG